MANVNSPKGLLRAVIYTRVSREAQSENTSLAGQFELCKRKAAEMGASVVGFFEETKSGGLYLTRGELQKALDVVESGEADLLILAKLDRTGREVESLRDIRRRVEAAGARLVFADGMSFEKNAVGDLMFTQLSAFAEFERALIKERMVAGLENTARQGLMPSRASSPYGYYIWKHKDEIRGLCTKADVGRYSLVEEQAKWIEPFFEGIASGKSIRQMAAWLTEQGAPTITGVPWGPATIRAMVRNPVYKGRPAWRRRRHYTDESRAAKGIGIQVEKPRPESEWIFLEAPALVSEDLWRRANEALDAGQAERSGANARRHMLAGILRCPRCGARLQSRSLPQHRDGVRYRNHMYKCKNTLRRQKHSVTTCDLPSMGGQTIENHVIEAIREILTRPELIQSAQKDFAARLQKESRAQDLPQELEKLRQQVKELMRREDESAQAEIEARLQNNDGSAFSRFRLQTESKRKEVEKQIESLENRIRSTELASEAVLPPVAPEVLMEVLCDTTMTGAARAVFLRPLVESIYPIVVPDELRVSAKQMRKAKLRTPDETIVRSVRFCGGCEIILRTGSGQPVYILTRRLVKWEPFRAANGRHSLRAIMDTSVRVEAESPFPAHQGRALGPDFDFELL